MTFQRPTYTADSLGGQIATFATISGLSSIPVSLQPANGRIVERFAKREMDINYVCYSTQDLSGLKPGDIGNDGTDKFIVQHCEDQAGRHYCYAAYLLRQT